MKLNEDQLSALKLLQSEQNVFLTGAAGSGKSYLLRHFLKERPNKEIPILASTGAAAILVGGRTFHSFFGLGIMEKGFQATVERATANKKVIKRLKKLDELVIDEISMLSGPVLSAAEAISRKIRGNSTPWGGIRIIAVGDFGQLPPVNPHLPEREWAFTDEVWKISQFCPAILNQIMRTQDQEFLYVLNDIRNGVCSERVVEFFKSRTVSPPENFKGTHLFSRRDQAEYFNLKCLNDLPSESVVFNTIYSGASQEIEKFKKHSPVGDSIILKTGARVMLRQNDPEGKWVNGSIGHIQKMTESELTIALLNKREISVKKFDFTLLNAEGEPVVTANNFPITLAWAITIHKAQGTTLEQMTVDLRNLWEPGHAYVALSRSKDPLNLFLDGWHPRSIKADPLVIQFHSGLNSYTG